MSEIPNILDAFLHASLLTFIIFLSEYCDEAPSETTQRQILFVLLNFLIVAPIPKTSSSG